MIRDKHVTNAAWMTFDGENKMTRFDISDSQTGATHYLYDADGERKQTFGEDIKSLTYLRGLGGELLGEGNGLSLSKEYAHRNGQMLVSATVKTISVLRWMVTDHLGTPRIVADKTGSLSGIKRHDYLPFGEEIGPTVGGRDTSQGYGNPQSDGVRQQFTGYERDQESGLDYAQARYFGSSLGRFTAVDPLAASASPGNPQSWNRYAYVANNPLGLIDPTGMVACPLDKKCETDADGEFFINGSGEIEYTTPIQAQACGAYDVACNAAAGSIGFGIRTPARGGPSPSLDTSSAPPLKTVEGIARLSEAGSFFPGIGTGFGIVAAATRAGQGDGSGAGMNLAMSVPFVKLAKAGKGALASDEVAEASYTAYRGINPATEVVEYGGITMRPPR